MKAEPLPARLPADSSRITGGESRWRGTVVVILRVVILREMILRVVVARVGKSTNKAERLS